MITSDSNLILKNWIITTFETHRFGQVKGAATIQPDFSGHFIEVNPVVILLFVIIATNHSFDLLKFLYLSLTTAIHFIMNSL